MSKNIYFLIAMLLVSCSYVQDPADREVRGSPWTPPISRKPLPPDFKLEPTFESIKTGILEQKCLDCHQAGGKAERIPLQTKEELVNSPHEIVIPGNSEESGLMLVLMPNARKPMPPPESRIPAVTEEEINVLRQWIDSGATE